MRPRDLRSRWQFADANCCPTYCVATTIVNIRRLNLRVLPEGKLLTKLLLPNDLRHGATAAVRRPKRLSLTFCSYYELRARDRRQTLYQL